MITVLFAAVVIGLPSFIGGVSLTAILALHRALNSRRQLSLVRPVNDVGNGVILPTPDDPRWEKARKSAWRGRKLCSSDISLGNLLMCQCNNHQAIFVRGGSFITGPRVNEYRAAVFNAFHARKALAAIEGD